LTASAKIRVVKKAHEIGITDVLLTGGDPLVLGEELLEVIESILQCNMRYAVSSTGSNLEYLTSVLDHRPSYINLSLDSPNAVDNDIYRGKGHFEQAVAAIQLCREKRTPARVNIVLTKRNVQQLEELIQSLDQLGVWKVTVAYPYPIEKGQAFAGIPDHASVATVTQRIHALTPKNLEQIVLVNMPGLKYGPGRCPSGENMLCVLPNGQYGGCSLLEHANKQNEIIGNFLDDSPEEIELKRKSYAARKQRLIVFLQSSGECPSGCLAAKSE